MYYVSIRYISLKQVWYWMPWVLRTPSEPRVLTSGGILELRSYEWHDVFTCQIWTTWRPNRCLSVLALVSGLSLHFGCFWSSLCGTTLYSQPQWKQLGGKSSWFDDSTRPPPRLDLHLIFIITVCPQPSSSVIHLNPYTHLRSIRHPTPTPAESAPNKNRPPSLASKKRCNENNGQQECTKPGLGVFHEAQQVRL